MTVKQRRGTGRDCLFEISHHGSIYIDDLAVDVSMFACCYLGSGNWGADHRCAYLADYGRTLADGLNSVYHVEDTWANYDLLAPVIDAAYQRWSHPDYPRAAVAVLSNGGLRMESEWPLESAPDEVAAHVARQRRENAPAPVAWTNGVYWEAEASNTDMYPIDMEITRGRPAALPRPDALTNGVYSETEASNTDMYPIDMDITPPPRRGRPAALPRPDALTNGVHWD